MRAGRRTTFMACGAVAALAVAAGPLFAATYTWVQGGTQTNWEDPLNWDSNGVPPRTTAGTEVIFSGSASGSIGESPNDARVTVGSVSWQTSFDVRSFGNWSTGGTGWIVDSGTPGTPATFTFSGGRKLSNYYVPWTLNSDLLLTGTGEGGLQVKAGNNNVSGAGGFIIDAGTLWFDNTHASENYTYSGGIEIRSAGRIIVNSGNGALSSGRVRIYEGGRLTPKSGGSVNNDFTFIVTSTNSTDVFVAASTTTFGGDFTFDLTDAGTVLDDSWQIVSGVAAYNQSTFSVVGFTESNGVWSATAANNSDYEFSEITGILRVTRALSDPGTILYGK